MKWEERLVGVLGEGGIVPELSERNEKYQKWAERDFSEKRLLGRWG